MPATPTDMIAQGEPQGTGKGRMPAYNSRRPLQKQRRGKGPTLTKRGWGTRKIKGRGEEKRGSSAASRARQKAAGKPRTRDFAQNDEQEQGAHLPDIRRRDAKCAKRWPLQGQRQRQRQQQSKNKAARLKGEAAATKATTKITPLGMTGGGRRGERAKRGSSTASRARQKAAGKPRTRDFAQNDGA
jgi:hypothetical protein